MRYLVGFASALPATLILCGSTAVACSCVFLALGHGVAASAWAALGTCLALDGLLAALVYGLVRVALQEGVDFVKVVLFFALGHLSGTFLYIQYAALAGTGLGGTLWVKVALAGAAAGLVAAAAACRAQRASQYRQFRSRSW